MQTSLNSLGWSKFDWAFVRSEETFKSIFRSTHQIVQISVQRLTLEELLALPKTKPASEYIYGQIIQKPIPQGKHSSIQTELSTAINAQLRPDKIAKAFSELRCTFGNRSFQISPFSVGTELCVIKMARLPMFFSWHQIGRLKSYLPIKVILTRLKISCIASIIVLRRDSSLTQVKKPSWFISHSNRSEWLINHLYLHLLDQ